MRLGGVDGFEQQGEKQRHLVDGCRRGAGRRRAKARVLRWWLRSFRGGGGGGRGEAQGRLWRLRACGECRPWDIQAAEGLWLAGPQLLPCQRRAEPRLGTCKEGTVREQGSGAGAVPRGPRPTHRQSSFAPPPGRGTAPCCSPRPASACAFEGLRAQRSLWFRRLTPPLPVVAAHPAQTLFAPSESSIPPRLSPSSGTAQPVPLRRPICRPRPEALAAFMLSRLLLPLPPPAPGPCWGDGVP